MLPVCILQVNISHICSTLIAEEFEAAIVNFRHLHQHVCPADIELKRPLDTKIFDRAQKQVFSLLERDPFVRWRKAIRDRVSKADGVTADVAKEELNSDVDSDV